MVLCVYDGYIWLMKTKDTDFSQHSEDYQRIARAIRFVEASFKSQPSLDEIAESAHLSKYHFQRLFKRWAGISPVQFLQFLTLEYAKEKLAESRSLLDTSLEAGLSGPSRLHDLFLTFVAMTPGEFKRLGTGLKIEYGFHPTPFGKCVLATTKRGICHLGFLDGDDRSTGIGGSEAVELSKGPVCSASGRTGERSDRPE